MTVSYTYQVATCRGLGNFYKLLFRWKGSIYKVIWAELIVYFICFYAINFFYRFYLFGDCDKKRFFIELVRYCDNYGKDIPISFVLGFYVNIVMTRWWDQFLYLPWPDAMALTVSVCVDGSDDRGRLIRRTMMRYANLCYVMAIKMMSTCGAVRFPTMIHLVEAGFLLEHERMMLDELNSKTTYAKYWAPIVWAGVVARRARKEGKIKDDISLNNVITVMNNFRRGCQCMLNYDWVNVPLVYTQVVTLAVYLYFLSALVGKQLIVDNVDEEPSDIYFPVFTFLEFFFYFGWLKVAECLINPYGDDDDDFEVNWMIDRYFQVSYVIVDEMHQEHPNLLKDQYWDEVFPIEIPYTEASVKHKGAEQGQVGSTKNIEVKAGKGDFVKMNDLDSLKYAQSNVYLNDPETDAEKDEGSKDSLTNAMRTMNETIRRRASMITPSVVEFGIHGTESKRRGSTFTPNVASPLDRRRSSTAVVVGSWGNKRHSIAPPKAMDVKMLMEQEDVQYNPTDDEEEKPDKKKNSAEKEGED